MHLRRISLCIAVVVLAALTQCSEGRHSVQRREVDDDVSYDDPEMADEASDDEAQNDAEGMEGDEEYVVVNGTVLTLPEHYNVTVGKTVQLECRVSPKEGLVVAWSKDDIQYFMGSAKVNGPDRLSIADSSSDLLIKDVQPSDSGKYKCSILQVTPSSVEHTVIVTEGPRIIRFSSSDQGNLVEGQNLLLTCDVAGSPKPEILWSRQKNNANKKLTEKDGEFSSNTFFARNVNFETSGVYFCYALNSVGHAEANITINVMGKPRVSVHRTIVNSDIGVEAVLECSAHEDPPAHIHWYKDGFLIEDSTSQYVISTRRSHSNLSVTPIGDLDFGTFTCEAENAHGKHNRSIELVQSPVVENIDADGPKLVWTVHSHQPLEEIEVQLRNIKTDKWSTFQVPLPETGEEKKHEYEIIYLIQDKIEPGEYEATVKVKNDKSWSPHVDPKNLNFVQAQPIQIASVFRSNTNNVHSIRPTAFATLSTTLMYLLVRML